MSSYNKKIFLIFLIFNLNLTQLLAAKPLLISAWPLPGLGKEEPSPQIKDDPVTVRLTCPSFSRLNLKSSRSESVVFRKVRVKPLAQGGEQWTYSLRSGIFWWNGERLKSQDLAIFFS